MEKKKYLFYWEESVDAYIPVPEKVEDMINTDSLEIEESQEIRFKVFEMSEEEIDNLPEC